MARITFYIYIQIYVAVTLLKLIFNFWPGLTDMEGGEN